MSDPYMSDHAAAVDESDDTSTYKPSSQMSTVLNMVNNIVGAGVLSLPWAFARSGWIGGFGLLGSIAVLSGFSMVILIRVSDKIGMYSYPALASYLASASLSGPSRSETLIPHSPSSRNPWPSIAVATCMLWYTFGVLMLYTVSLGELCHCLTDTLFPKTVGSIWLSETAVKLYSGIGFFVLSSFKSFAHLGPTSFLALALIIYTTILMGVRYFDPFSVTVPTNTTIALSPHHPTHSESIVHASAVATPVPTPIHVHTPHSHTLTPHPSFPSHPTPTPPFSHSHPQASPHPTPTPTSEPIHVVNSNPTSLFNIQALRAAPAVSLAYCMHYNVPVFYQQLAKRSPRRMYQVAASVMAIVVAIYILVGGLGYATWGEATQDVIVLMYIFPPQASYNEGVIGQSPLVGKDVLFVIAAFGIVVHFVFVFPLIAIACRNAFFSLLRVVQGMGGSSDRTANQTAYGATHAVNDDRENPYAVVEERRASSGVMGWLLDPSNESASRILVTACIVGLCVGIACAVECVSVVLVFNGAVCGVFIVYIFPALLALATERSPLFRVGAVVLILFGIAIGVGGVALQVQNMIVEGPTASCKGACTAFHAANVTHVHQNVTYTHTPTPTVVHASHVTVTLPPAHMTATPPKM